LKRTFFNWHCLDFSIYCYDDITKLYKNPSFEGGFSGRFGWAIDFLTYADSEFAQEMQRGGVCVRVKNKSILLGEEPA
jgi:hypothetical protein